jgi:hypothetical protein
MLKLIYDTNTKNVSQLSVITLQSSVSNGKPEMIIINFYVCVIFSLAHGKSLLTARTDAIFLSWI